jgi:hypothetical protein
VYGRKYRGRELRFEPSGGLIANTLVMVDKETDSYWSLIGGVSLAGEYEGTPLDELTVGEKTRWKEWVAKHPDTLVLSVDGIEHSRTNPYANYMASNRGYGGAEADDDRLATKTSIYGFQRGGRIIAVPFAAFEDGAVFDLGEEKVFLYRPGDIEVFYSTSAFVDSGKGFRKRKGTWVHIDSGARFDPEQADFLGGDASEVSRLDGFDTFWFNWSMTHPDTEVLGAD